MSLTRLFGLGVLALFLGSCTPSPSPDKPAVVWIEVSANFPQYGNSVENIRADCKRIADMGFTHVAVEVLPAGGRALFRSQTVPPLTSVRRWSPDGPVELPRTAGFDYLDAFIQYGHEAGLKVIAAVNMMVVSDLERQRDWCAVDLLPDGTLMSQASNPAIQGARFLDPANPDVQEYLLQVLTEVSAYEGLDGIVMDRCRYDDYALDAGYTPAAREQFAAYLGREPERWPVFQEPGHVFLEGTPDELEVQWLTFRCKVIHDFVAKAVEAVHAVREDLPLGAYVGAWFSEYYRSGVNWTSPSYDLAREEPTFSWATPEYQATGFADLVDFLFLGAYAPAADIHGNVEKTMEGYAKLGKKRLCGDVPFAAGPDIGNGKDFEAGGCADLLPEIKETLLSQADGFFLFDLCHIRMFDYWDAFKAE